MPHACLPHPYLEVAKEAEVQKLAHHIESALGAAEDLISDLLDISRLESGKIDLHPHSFAIMDVLSNLNAEFSALAAKQGVQFSLVPSSLWVNSDPKLLRRVIQNFLTNAFRYNPNGKVILGCAESPPGKCVLMCGISGLVLKKISSRKF